MTYVHGMALYLLCVALFGGFAWAIVRINRFEDGE